MEYKKNIKDGGIMSHTTSTSVAIFGVSTSKKCERLATAIYLVTNFLSDTEPMKMRLRALSLELVRDASLLKSGRSGLEVNVLGAIRENISETLSLFELAFVTGLVSEMNFTILKREYRSLSDTIEIKKTSRESRTDSILGDNFFGESELVSHPRSDLTRTREGRTFMYPPHATQNDATKQTSTLAKGHSIGQTTTTMSDRKTKEQASVSKGPTFVSPSPRSDLYVSAPSPRAATDITKESRRTRILKLIKDNREVTIKDIATHFADLSEKTIQRELVSLVESNVLKKFGERRWSRYALA